MKREKVFRCTGCNRLIDYGSGEAMRHDGELYCSEECMLESIGADYVDWENEEVKYIELDRTNAFGVYKIGTDWFSNGHYLVFDRFRSDQFKLDFTYAEAVDLSHCKSFRYKRDICEIYSSFDKFKDDFVKLEQGMFDVLTRTEKDPLLPDMFVHFNVKDKNEYFNKDYFEFVKDYLSDGEESPEIYGLLGTDTLLLKVNGKKAIILSNIEPKEHPERFFEEANQ